MHPDRDPFSSAWREDPYPLYRELREHAPVHFAPSLDAWCVSRFEDVQQVLKTPEVFSSRAMFTLLINGGNEGLELSWPGIRAAFRLMVKMRTWPSVFWKSRMLIASDGKAHTAMRSIVNRGFTPRRIEAWEPRIRTVTEACLEPLREGEPFDLVRDLAVPLPLTIISEMLGIPEERKADFKRWSDCIIFNATGPGRAEPFNDAFLTTMEELFDYFGAEIEARQAGGELGDDLIGTLLASQEGDEQPLTIFELIQFVVLLLVAGNETTTNLIGNGIDALLAHPEQLAAVANDLTQVPALIEETLRYDAPVQNVFRTTTCATEIAGVAIPKGAIVAAMIGSANRDDRRFPDADRFDVTRNPQGHVAFGFGKHFCLGASLARLEARAAFEGIIPELRDAVVAPGKTEHIDSFLVRGPARLAIQLRA